MKRKMEQFFILNLRRWTLLANHLSDLVSYGGRRKRKLRNWFPSLRRRRKFVVSYKSSFDFFRKNLKKLSFKTIRSHRRLMRNVLPKKRARLYTVLNVERFSTIGYFIIIPLRAIHHRNKVYIYIYILIYYSRNGHSVRGGGEGMGRRFVDGRRKSRLL